VKLVAADGTLLEMNQAGLAMIEVEGAQEALGRCVYDLIAPEHRGAYREFNERVCRGEGGTLEFEIVGIRGTRRRMETHAVPLRDAAGRLTHLAVTRDVTGRRRTEEALRISEERHRQLADNLPSGFIYQLVHGADGSRRFSYISGGVEALCGVTPAEVTADPMVLYGLIPQEDLPRMRAEEEASLRDRKPFDCQFRVRSRGGPARWLHCRSAPRPLPDGGSTWDGIAVDITERVGMEQALREADRRKDEFLAMLAHELRNPLASISNAVQVVKRSDADEHREWSREVVENQLAHLSRLIDDLLDVSRITRGKIQLRKDQINVIPILEHALESVRPLVEERRHELSASFDHGLWVQADPTRLEQVAVNLLTNAAKYTQNEGHIRLTARREGDAIAIAVKDDGVGIPPEKLPQMFEMFAQGDRSLARSEGGLGIGLTLVKTLTELHGGSITATSEGAGKGCEFVVRLPAITPPISKPDARKPARQPEGRSSRILVIDDNIDTARGLGRLLRLLGHEVATSHDGPAALEAAREHRPEFVLLDIGLPGMDGYEVARRLRQDEGCKDAVLVAISGYGQDEDRRRSKQAGIDHHLVKPIDHDALVTLLARDR